MEKSQISFSTRGHCCNTAEAPLQDALFAACSELLSVSHSFEPDLLTGILT